MANANPAHPIGKTHARKPKGRRGLLRRVRALLGGDAAGLMPEAVPFQGDLDEIITAIPPRGMRQMQYVVVALLTALIVVSAFVKVEMVVVGMGQLVPDEPPIVLQPMERAIILERKVKIGDI